ncbi:MAG: T9SS type A sorting domain-containing protein [Bacteroidota bacterium]
MIVVTSTQHKTYFSSEWETYSFKFAPGIWGSTDITDIAGIEFYRLDKETIDANLYLKWIALGDTTTQTITLIDENEEEDANLICYPNPVTNQLNVSGIENISEAVITDITGKNVVIADANEVSNGIDVSGLPNGLYIVRFKTANGIIVEQLIK